MIFHLLRFHRRSATPRVESMISPIMNEEEREVCTKNLWFSTRYLLFSGAFRLNHYDQITESSFLKAVFREQFVLSNNYERKKKVLALVSGLTLSLPKTNLTKP